MPCNSRTLQTVTEATLQNAVPDLMLAALEQVRGRVQATVDWRKGEGLIIQSYRTLSEDVRKAVVAEVKREYSRQAVTWAAKRAGWQVKQVDQTRMTMERR